MKNNPRLSAYSLIEVSMAMLIIGILIAGVFQGIQIIARYKINTANSLTKSSAVHSISDLVLWLDATNEDSLSVGTLASNSYSSNKNDQDLVVNWIDVNPRVVNKITAAAPSDTRRPTYVTKGINGLPSLKFDGTDYLQSTAQVPLPAGDKTFTYVIVWSISQNGTGSEILLDQGNTSGDHAGLRLNSSPVGLGFWANGAASWYPVARPASVDIPHITIIRVNAEKPDLTIFHDSNNDTTYNSTASALSSLAIGKDYFQIGHPATGSTHYFHGNISEIIIFDRALKIEEITEINSYLSKKYNIAVS